VRLADLTPGKGRMRSHRSVGRVHRRSRDAESGSGMYDALYAWCKVLPVETPQLASEDVNRSATVRASRSAPSLRQQVIRMEARTVPALLFLVLSTMWSNALSPLTHRRFSCSREIPLDHVSGASITWQSTSNGGTLRSLSSGTTRSIHRPEQRSLMNRIGARRTAGHRVCSHPPICRCRKRR